MSCSTCGHRSPLVIDIDDPRSRGPVRLVTCTRCETRTWQTRAGTPVHRDGVLQTFAARDDFTFAPSSRGQGSSRMAGPC